MLIKEYSSKLYYIFTTEKTQTDRCLMPSVSGVATAATVYWSKTVHLLATEFPIIKQICVQEIKII